MKKSFMLLEVAVLLGVGECVAAEGASEYARDFECARQLQEALKQNDKTAVASLIAYPVMREKPLPPIVSKKDFIDNWDDFFDAAIISALVDSKPEVVGWRGVMLANGSIWFGDGKLKVLNMRTAAFEKKFATLRARDSAILYPAAQGYKRIELECDALEQHIRIQKHEDGLYYFAWKKGEALSEKPISLLKGSVEAQGLAGSRLYTFKDVDSVYEVLDSSLCEEPTCAVHITSYKDSQQVSEVICH